MTTNESPYYVRTVNNAINRATLGESHLTAFHMAIEGMSSHKGRHLLNNIMKLRCMGHRPRYLEVGSWKGSTLCAAVFGHDVEAVAIDNFSQFTDVSFASFTGSKADPRPVRDVIMSNLSVSRLFSKPQFDAAVIDQDCFTVDPVTLGGLFDVYFYDGEHTAEAQYKGITHFASVLADTAIVIVDDAHDASTQEATKRAFADSGLVVIRDWLLYDECNGTDAGRMKDGWWNGMYVAVVAKGGAK